MWTVNSGLLWRSAALSGLVSLLFGIAGVAQTQAAQPDVFNSSPSAVQSVFVHVPTTLPAGGRMHVLVALHGMGGTGQDFSRDLLDAADANGWLVIAPTITYGNWMDPNQVAGEEPSLVAWLNGYLDALPGVTGMTVAPRVLLLGHSRGAQLALHFAEFHPEHVAAVAALSAGTYTLPLNVDGSNTTMLFPFGIADLAARDGGQPFDLSGFESLPIWIGVGANDANPGDLPRAWDAYLGTTRVQRARAFADTLQQLGMPVTLTIFPGATHALTPEMRQMACARLAATMSDGTAGSGQVAQ